VSISFSALVLAIIAMMRRSRFESECEHRTFVFLRWGVMRLVV
jgi:hypothetical protein